MQGNVCMHPECASHTSQMLSAHIPHMSRKRSRHIPHLAEKDVEVN